MSSVPETQAQEERAGLIAGIGGLARNIAGLLLCRLELAALELAEARSAALKLGLVFAAGVLAAWFALAGWSALIVVLTWDSLGWKIIAILAVLFTLTALGMVWYARNLLAQGQLSLPATMAELRNDRDAFTQEGGA